MKQIPILTYHSVSGVSTGELAPYTIRPQLFAEHMDMLRHERYTVWTVAQTGDAIAAHHRLPDRLVGLTFDDAFADFVQEAVPVLQRFGFPATLYVPTANLGGTSTWLTHAEEDLRPMLTAEQVSSLPSGTVECGAHSHTHAELDRLPPNLLTSEVLRPKLVLEEIIGRPVRTFAYPFGYYDRRVRAAVRRAGYDYACATGHRSAWQGADRYALPRFLVLADTDAEDVLTLMRRPAAPFADQTLDRGKQLLWRASRRLSRSDGGRAAAEAASSGRSPPADARRG